MSESIEEVIVPVKVDIDFPEGMSNIMGDYSFRIMSGEFAGYQYVFVDTGNFDESGEYAVAPLSEIPEGEGERYIKKAQEHFEQIVAMALDVSEKILEEEGFDTGC